MSDALPFDSDRKPWERQTWESAAAYGHFRAYAAWPYSPENRADDGRPGVRSLRELAGVRGVSLSTLKTHSAGKRWAERAAAYDEAQLREESAQVREAQRAASLRTARFRVRATDRLQTLFDRIAERVEELLAFPISEDSEPEVIEGPDGEALWSVVRVANKQWTPGNAVGLVNALRALYVVAGDDGAAALRRLEDAVDFDALTLEQLERIENGESVLEVALSGLALHAASEGESGA